MYVLEVCQRLWFNKLCPSEACEFPTYDPMVRASSIANKSLQELGKHVNRVFQWSFISDDDLSSSTAISISGMIQIGNNLGKSVLLQNPVVVHYHICYDSYYKVGDAE